jgi:hypothetical protein
MARMTREEYRERGAEKVAAAQEVLAAEIASLVTGDDWRGSWTCNPSCTTTAPTT